MSFFIHTLMSWKPGYSGMMGKVHMLTLFDRRCLIALRAQLQLLGRWGCPSSGGFSVKLSGPASFMQQVLRHITEAGPSISARCRRIWKRCVFCNNSSSFPLMHHPVSPLVICDAECQRTQQSNTSEQDGSR